MHPGLEECEPPLAADYAVLSSTLSDSSVLPMQVFVGWAQVCSGTQGSTS